MKTICLVMIVKNEIPVLKRAFDSVCDYIDYWVISDTGSTDGTQDFIKSYFIEKKIPGELHYNPWKNFGHNRTKAVQAAHNKADYLLLMDADFVFCPKNPNFKNDPNLIFHGYHIKYEGGLDYRQMLLASGKILWKYVGVTHEYITCDVPNKRYGRYDGFTFLHHADGGNRSDKFQRDIRLLKQGIQDEPNNIRYVFYLAQSHKDIGNWTKAIKYYKKRIEMGGWDEEIYQSLLHIGMCKMRRGDSFDEFKDDYLKAYNYRPVRLEALYFLVSYCNAHKMPRLGYTYGIKAVDTPYPKNDILFIDKNIHDWKFLDELVRCAYSCGEFLEALKIYKKLEDRKTVPDSAKPAFDRNKEIFRKSYLKYITELHHENRVAIIVQNHNNKSTVDKLALYVSNNVRHAHDLIIIDNGSDKDQISERTTIGLKTNVHSTNGWLLGLNYADTLETVKDFKYYAYCLINGNVEFGDKKDDFVSRLVKTLKEKEKVVGIYSADEQDESELSKLPNRFRCYRTSWFNEINRIDSKSVYGVGIDAETAFHARNSGNQIVVDEELQFNNCNFSEISKKAVNNSVQYFKKKYGPNYEKVLGYT